MTLHVWHVDLANKPLGVDGIRASVDVMRDHLEGQQIRTRVVGPHGRRKHGVRDPRAGRRQEDGATRVHPLTESQEAYGVYALGRHAGWLSTIAAELAATGRVVRIAGAAPSVLFELRS